MQSIIINTDRVINNIDIDTKELTMASNGHICIPLSFKGFSFLYQKVLQMKVDIHLVLLYESTFRPRQHR